LYYGLRDLGNLNCRAIHSRPEGRGLSRTLVSDDSMSPTIEPNEFVFIEGLHKIPEHRNGIWLINTSGLLLIRRIQWLSHDKYKTSNDNHIYDPTETDETTQFLGRVVGGSPKQF